MKFPKIKQSELNTILLLGIGICLLLASFAYFYKIRQTEGLENQSDWELTTDGGDVALQYKDTSAFKLTEDGSIKNSTIDKIMTRIGNLETRMNDVTGITGKEGTAGTAGEAGTAGSAGPEGSQGPEGKKGPKGPIGDKGPKGAGC
jgi:opacity protein-like surface antigen